LDAGYEGRGKRWAERRSYRPESADRTQEACEALLPEKVAMIWAEEEWAKEGERRWTGGGSCRPEASRCYLAEMGGGKDQTDSKDPSVMRATPMTENRR
jgi:hypothetical protein